MINPWTYDAGEYIIDIPEEYRFLFNLTDKYSPEARAFLSNIYGQDVREKKRYFGTPNRIRKALIKELEDHPLKEIYIKILTEVAEILTETLPGQYLQMVRGKIMEMSSETITNLVDYVEEIDEICEDIKKDFL